MRVAFAGGVDIGHRFTVYGLRFTVYYVPNKSFCADNRGTVRDAIPANGSRGLPCTFDGHETEGQARALLAWATTKRTDNNAPNLSGFLKFMLCRGESGALIGRELATRPGRTRRNAEA